MRSFFSVQLSKFIDDVRASMSTPAHKEVEGTAGSTGHAVQELLTDTEEGLQRALKTAANSETSLIFDYNRYRVVIANPVKASISTVGAGGILITDGENSIFFDTVTRSARTDGEVHSRGLCYWDLGPRDDEDGVFIVRQMYDQAGRIPDADTV